MEKPVEEKSKSTWWKFKRWCYIYHRELAITMMIILIIIGIWFNPFDDVKTQVEYQEQDGGGVRTFLQGAKSAAKYTGTELANKHTNRSLIAKEGPNIKLDDIASRKSRMFQKASALTGSAASGTLKKLGQAPDYVMDKFRENASLIYEVFYQIAFIVIILLIVFPTVGFFIIGIICFIILRDKLAYLKSL